MAGHLPSTNKATFNQQHEERKGKERREERVEEEAGGQGSERRPQNLVNDLLYLNFSKVTYDLGEIQRQGTLQGREKGKVLTWESGSSLSLAWRKKSTQLTTA